MFSERSILVYTTSQHIIKEPFSDTKYGVHPDQSLPEFTGNVFCSLEMH